jgi:hypothetical protein
VISEILISDDAIKSEKVWAVTQDVCDFVNDLREKRGYIDEELPLLAMQVYAVVDWIDQVNNGGVSQYIANLELYLPQNQLILDRTEQALVTLGADGFLALYRQMRRILANDIRPDGRPVKDGDMERIEAEFEKQSLAFDEINGDCETQHLTRMMRAFILAQPNTRILPTDARRAALIRLGNENPHRKERFAERKRAQYAFESQYPIYAAARQICAKAGRTFERLNAGSANLTLDGVAMNGMALATDKGPCMMICTPSEALLFDLKQPPAEVQALLGKGGDEWLDYIDAHPDAYDGLETYRRDEGLLATLSTPTPLWPK